MPENTEDVEDDAQVVKNVNFDETVKKSKKEKPTAQEEDDSEEDNDEYDEDHEDDEDDEEDDNDDSEGFTEVGLYNVLGNFLVDEVTGNSVGVSLANIAKELSKLNHILKKYTSK